LEVRAVLVAALLVDPGDEVGGEVDDLLELLGLQLLTGLGAHEQVGQPRAGAAQVPDVDDRRRQLDVAHPLPADLGAGDLHAAALADDPLEPDALVLAAVALPVLGGTEDLLAEEAVLLRLEGPVVDGLRLLHLAVRPGADRVRGGQTDPELAEVVDVEQFVPSRLETSAPALVFLVGAALGPGQVDAQLLGRPEDVFVELSHLDLLAGLGEDLDVEAQGLHLLDEHLEALRDAGLGDVLALDDRLVDLDPAEHVVGLDREQLLQAVGGAVGLEGPHLHLAEPLAAELGLTAERLLGDHRVRAGRPGVALVVHEVGQLPAVHEADGHRVVEGLAGATVVEDRLAVLPDEPTVVAVLGIRALRVEVLEDPLDRRVLAGPVHLVPVGAVEHRRGHQARRRGGGTGLGLGAADGLVADDLAVDRPAPAGRVAEVRLEHLAHVHPGRDAERVEDDVDGGAVLEEGHLLDREDLGDHALVAVAAGQLVADRDLPLLADVHPHQLVHAGRQLVAVLPGEDLDVDDLALFAVGHLERGVAHLAGLLAEDGAEQALLGGELGLALGGDLADEHVAGADLGADPDDPALVEVLQDVLGEVRDVPGDLLRAELRVAGVDLVLVDVDRG